jgi:hypothetical protein
MVRRFRSRRAALFMGILLGLGSANLGLTNARAGTLEILVSEGGVT